MRLTGEKGQATVMAALTLPVICGFLGLALDVGSFYAEKRKIQTAADASAKAAVLELKRGKRTSMLTAATAAAADYGLGGGAVTMNFPPTSGQYIGNQKYVEVIIGQQIPTMFMRFMVSGSTVEVRGRAVAGLDGLPPAGLFILSRTRARALEVSAGSELTSDLDVWVSSNSASGVSVTSGSCMTAPGIGVTGGYEGSCFSSTPVIGMIPDEDPLADLPPPQFSGCDYVDLEVKHQTVTLAAGVYCGGVDISTNAVVQLAPGVHVMRGGGFRVSSNSTVSGTGVVIYNTGDVTYPAGNISFANNSDIALSAPSSGALAGVLFFFDRSLAAQSVVISISSSADTHLEGTIYALKQHCEVQSGTKSNNLAPWMIMVCDTLSVSGGSRLNIPADFDTSSVPSPIRAPVLVE